jgi:Flp pilus assembly protein TadD/transglutaminase-like putative cysteine protease
MKKIYLTIICLLIGSFFFGLDVNQIKEKIKDKQAIEQIIILERYISENPKNISLYTLKAEIEIKSKDFIGARTTLLQAAQIEKDNLKVLNLLGLSNYNLGQFEEAAKYFNEVLILDKENDFALSYLSLTNPVSGGKTSPQNAASEKKEIKSPLNIKKLDENFNPATDTKSDFVYLINKKEVNVLDDKTFNYTIHCVVKLLTNKGVNTFRDFYYSYNSFEYFPDVEIAGTYDSDYNYKEIDKNNIVFVDKKDASSSTYTNRKYVAFPFPNVKPGNIVEYRITFNSTGNVLAPKLFDQFLFGSFENSLEKELTINYPQNIPLQIYTKGSGFTQKEYTIGNKIQKIFNYKNPPVYSLQNETTTIYDISPQVIMGTFENWDSVAKWYSSVFEEALKNSKIETEIFKKLDIQNESKIEKTKKIYEFIQNEIHYVALELNESALKPHTPDETYKNKFGDCKDQVILFVYLLRKIGIDASPVLISTLDNGFPEKKIASPFYFNHVISYIPKQDGIDEDLFLDTTNVNTAFGNIPSIVQESLAFIVNKNGTGFFKEIPAVSFDKNKIEETYKMTINQCGNGEINFSYKNSGGYAEAIRYSFQNKTKSQIYDYFFNLQKKNYTNLKKENFIINGLDSQSGDINISLNSVENGISNVFYDGKQKITFSIKDITSLFGMPNETQFDYRKTFIFSYTKKVEYIFPEGYKIIEGEVKNLKKENEYLIFEIEPDMISENHFLIKINLTLKKRLIKKADLTEVIAFIQSSINDSNLELTLQKTENFDYESFYKELSQAYKQKEIYENYIRKMVDLKKNDKAIEVCDEAIKFFPDNNNFRIIKSILLLDKNDFTAAESSLKEALAEDENNTDIYAYLISIYKKTNDDVKLEKILNETNEKFFGNSIFTSEMLTFYRRKENYSEALKYLDKLIQKNSENSFYFAEKGFFYSMIKDFKNSETAFLKAIELDEKNATALNNLAWLYCENNTKIKEAIEFSRRACELDKFNDGFLDTLAEAYYKNGDYDQAVEAIKKAMKINPNYTYLEQQFEKIEKAKKTKEK